MSLRFHPVRPSGLGEVPTGRSVQANKGSGRFWRVTTVLNNAAEGSITYEYRGELEQFGYLGQTVEFSASEKHHGNRLIWARVAYSTPMHQKFQGPGGKVVKIWGVARIKTEYRDSSTDYLTTVTTVHGQAHTFTTSASGVVTGYETGVSFLCA
jgi:hypothetical protein